MLTIFTIPKPFRDNISIIQTNAIRSWTLLRPECEIILFGNEEGTAEIARKLGVQHVPDVKCNEYGTPLVSSVFSLAQNMARNQLMGFVNTDIILMSDFLPAVQRIHKNRFLMVGLRWDLDLNELVNFEDTQWELHLRNRMAERGKLHPPGGGGDYFIFPRGLFDYIPPFAIGRAAWDNWFIYRARELKVPVVDATKAFINVHQNHDYSHHPEGTAGVWEGPERTKNIELMGGKDHSFTTEYATWLLTSQGLKRALSLKHLYLRIYASTVLVPYLRFLNAFMKSLTRLIRRDKLTDILRSSIDLVSIIISPLSRLLGRNKLRILQYHRICDLPETDDVMSFLNVPPKVFANQMEFLSQNGFNVITLEKLIDCKEKNIKLSPRTVIITFDDGYRDNYLNAFPILEKYNLKGTFFVVTDYIGSDKTFDWLKLDAKSLIHARENKQYWLPLTREDILTMNARGACFGSHSKSHCSFNQVDEGRAMEELTGSKECLEEILQKPVRCFCYPFGDENKSVKNLVQRTGYCAAVTTKMGSDTLNSDFFSLRRIPVSSLDSPGKFKRKVEGAYDWWFKWLLPIVVSVEQIISRGRRKNNGIRISPRENY